MKKTAILFGINDYPKLALKNAVNDATALAECLEKLDFNVNCNVNVKAENMHRAIEQFKADLEKSSVGVFFFAGHGIQCKGENFLATTDTSFEDETSCKYTAVPLNMIIDIFEESKVNTKIIILDACRDNPFAKWRSSGNEGLAPVYAPKGTIIAFSTSPGQKASDGAGVHGVYTNALLSHIGTKNLSIEDMFKRVRNTVSSHTNHKQITWEHTSLMGTFCFNSGDNLANNHFIYSESALADEIYGFQGEDDIESIVQSLKTYNWYKQNPAISKINNINFSKSDKEDVFVLGRNIYQTACGGSASAVEWIDNIENNLNGIDKNAAKHLLNGILFEIYFNSAGRLREKIKSKYFEKPVRLCEKEKYSSCGSFIKTLLEQYPQRVLYLPGSNQIVTVDIVVSTDTEHCCINGIYLEGLNCMYEKDGNAIYNPGLEDWPLEVEKSQLESSIAHKIVVPKNRIKFTYSWELSKDDKIQFPSDYKLLRYVL